MDDAFDGDFSDDDWEHNIGGQHVVVDEVDGPVAHAAVVPRVLEIAGRDFRSGYVEGVATVPARQRAGLASVVMAEAGDIIRRHFELGGLSTDRYRFYERLGWERWHGPTFARTGSEATRTQEDDDGVMVLRFGASADVDLRAAISCEARPGDDW